LINVPTIDDESDGPRRDEFLPPPNPLTEWRRTNT
jgi:hypothetical protein